MNDTQTDADAAVTLAARIITRRLLFRDPRHRDDVARMADAEQADLRALAAISGAAREKAQVLAATGFMCAPSALSTGEWRLVTSLVRELATQ
jgi:hypothetical protein